MRFKASSAPNWRPPTHTLLSAALSFDLGRVLSPSSRPEPTRGVLVGCGGADGEHRFVRGPRK